MLFNSLLFVIFFLTVRSIYGLLKHRQQNVLLLTASYIFYGAWDPRFLGLLFLSTAIDYVCALMMNRPQAARRNWMWLSVSTNLAILAAFKYFGFFATEFSRLLAGLGYDVSPLDLQIILPVGISFYTFQSLSYTIDVYRGRQAPTRDPIAFSLYVAFFPQLVAGPIERASQLIPQIQSPRRVSAAHWDKAIWFLLLGYFQKVVVADNLAPYVERLARDPSGLRGGELAIGFYMMAVFIYADFSGYSNIARGLANAFGFDLSQNFRMPLFARNPAEFWRRWHISLTAWFRDYVFYPLARLWGEQRPSRRQLAAAALITFILVGLWHGAAWNFVAFGFYHGLLLISYYGIKRTLRGRGFKLPLPLWMRRVGQHVLAFHLISAGTVLFIIPDPQDWVRYFNDLFSKSWAVADPIMVWTFFGLSIPLLLIDLVQERRRTILAIPSMTPFAKIVLYSVLWIAILLSGAVEPREFVYFQF